MKQFKINPANLDRAMGTVATTCTSDNDNTINAVQVFVNPQFGEIRTTVIDGEPWFVGKDVAERLGYSNTADAILKHIDEEDRLESQIAISGQNRKVILINESGLYSLVLRSQLPTAKQFKRWVTSEVLPAIRRRGTYSISMPDFRSPAAAARAWADEYERRLLAENDVLELSAAVQRMQPKVTYCDIVLQTPDAVTVTQIAADYGMSAKTFNKVLAQMDIQRKVRGQWVLTAPYITEGYTVSRTHLYSDRKGNNHTAMHTYWTQKGRLFIYHKFNELGLNPIAEIEVEK